MSKKSMNKEKYVLKGQVHFGSLKTSVSKGTIISVDFDNNTVLINGNEYHNVHEIELGIKAGFIVPYVQGETDINNNVKISSKAQKNKKTYAIEKSDVDNMSKDLKVEKPVKKEKKASDKIEVIRETVVEEARGLKVILNDAPAKTETDNHNIMQVINGDDGEVVAKISLKEETKPKGVAENTGLVMDQSDSESLNAINGEQGTVVKKIGKSENTKEVSTGNKLATKKVSAKSKKEAEAKAKATAEARKKASEARRAKAAKEEK